jgi:hypothetical protein
LSRRVGRLPDLAHRVNSRRRSISVAFGSEADNGWAAHPQYDRVADLTVLGSNAAYRTLRAERLARVPAGLDVAEAAGLILSWMDEQTSRRPGATPFTKIKMPALNNAISAACRPTRPLRPFAPTAGSP